MNSEKFLKTPEISGLIWNFLFFLSKKKIDGKKKEFVPSLLSF